MKKVSKQKKIRTLLDQGKSTQEIAKALKIKPAYIYAVRSQMKKESQALPEVTVQEEEAMQEVANKVQVGGEHYKNKDIQPWDAIHAWGLGFFSGNVVKYVARYREKNGVEDLKKARHYLDKLIEIMEGK